MDAPITGGRRIVTRTLRAGVAAVAALALAGCFKIDMDLTLDEDLVSGSVIMGIDKEFIEWAEQMGEGSADDLLSELDTDELEELEGATVEPYEDDSYVGQRISFADVSLDEFNDPDDSLNIVYDADSGTYTVAGDMDMRDFDDEASMDEAEEFLPPGMTDALTDAFDITVAITFPGEVTEHNGELSGSTVTWRPVPGELNEMSAVARTGGSTPVALIAGVGLAVLAVAAVLGFWLTRRNRPEPGRPPDGEPGAPEPHEPPVEPGRANPV